MRVIFGEHVGGGGGGGRKKSGRGTSWTTAAQDEGEWRKSAEQVEERFMTKWMAAEKARAGLRHAVVLVTPECGGKDQGEDSPNQACSRWFARHDNS